MNCHNLRKARKACSLTQADLAAEIGISRNRLSQCEAGNADFSTTVLVRACEVLGVEASYLVDSCKEEAPEAAKNKAADEPEICFSAADFADRLRAARKSSGLTQRDVAEKLGATQANYSKYEKGTVTPRADSLVRFAQAVGTSVPYLLGLADDPAQATLTDEESRLVADYRTMCPDLKGVLAKTAAAFARPAEGAGG